MHSAQCTGAVGAGAGTGERVKDKTISSRQEVKSNGHWIPQVSRKHSATDARCCSKLKVEHTREKKRGPDVHEAGLEKEKESRRSALRTRTMHYAVDVFKRLKISILVHYLIKIRRDESRNVKKRTPKTETTTIDTRQQAKGNRRNSECR
jgi:hypothetical protein